MKNNKSTWVPHVFTVIKKENWHYKSSSFRGEELYRGETTPWYVSTFTLHNDLQIPFIREEIKRYSTIYYKRLIGHENGYVTE
jgi:hypothetical protein